MHPNPFTHRGMIQEEAAFVGRSREIGNTLNRLRNGSSVSIVGERRIGKSSLLYQLYLSGKRRLEDHAGERYHFVYLDMHDARMRTPTYFVKSALHRLGIPADDAALEKQPMVVLANILEAQRSENRALPILLLDEFEEITQHKDLFNDDFLEAMRSFCNSRQLALVTVSRRSLKELCKSRNLTSPFFNVFTKVKLGEFVVDARIDEVTEFIRRYWKDGLAITPKEEEWLRRMGKKHPMRLQIAGYWILENRQQGLSRSALKKKIRREFLDAVFTPWEKLTAGLYNASIKPVLDLGKWAAELWVNSKK